MVSSSDLKGYGRLEANSGAPAQQTREACMVQDQRNFVSAFECDILREAFRKSVVENGIPEAQWRDLATALTRTFTGLEGIEPALLDWIVQK